ncbi:MAG: hypothetical protein NTZ02_01020 [Candidatus Woesearchaeota archaeon]|nr:hypothetical protein [Candidatus Woesearchaeota archaeon]
MDEYWSMAARKAREEAGRKCRFSSIDALLSETYESNGTVMMQLSGIAEEMKHICDSIGESFSMPSIIYNVGEQDSLMQRMADFLESYASNTSLDASTRYSAEKSIEMIRKVSKISPGSQEKIEEPLKELLNAYSAFDNFAGNDKPCEIDVSGVIARIAGCDFNGIGIESCALDSEKAYATESGRLALEKIAYFMRDSCGGGSRIIFSAEKQDGFVTTEAWCSRRAISYESIPALIKNEWRLLLAEYIAEKNGSRLEISPPGREYLDIKIRLPVKG